MPKLVWRVKLVAELRPGVMTEIEVARIERDEQAGLAELGLQLAEAKQLTAALQAQIVPAQVAVVGASSDTSATCWAISNATRQRWCITRPGVGEESRSRPRSWRARSMRSWPSA